MTDEIPRARPEASGSDSESFMPATDGSWPLQPGGKVPEAVLEAVARVLESLSAWDREERGQDGRSRDG